MTTDTGANNLRVVHIRHIHWYPDCGTSMTGFAQVAGVDMCR